MIIQDKHTALVELVRTQAQVYISDTLEKDVSLHGITENELMQTDEWIKLPERKAAWDWRVAVKKERQKSKRVEASFYCNSTLCALMLARFSRGRVNVSIRYVEANPLPHPLERQVMTAVIIFSEQFAYAIRAKLVSISNPVESMVNRYRERGYELTPRDQWREARGHKPRCDLLVKEIQPRFDTLLQSL